jgi:hypothetical protein
MWLPTQDQVNAASRHAISIVGTAFVIFGLQAKGISLDQVKAAITALGSVVNDLIVLIGTLAPFYALLKAASTASHANQIQAVQDIATGPRGFQAVNAQAALIHATQAIAQDRSIPTSQAAANVLVSATAALPQVQTIVTDKKTADASSSPSVVPAQAA